MLAGLVFLGVVQVFSMSNTFTPEQLAKLRDAPIGGMVTIESKWLTTCTQEYKRVSEGAVQKTIMVMSCETKSCDPNVVAPPLDSDIGLFSLPEGKVP